MLVCSIARLVACLLVSDAAMAMDAGQVFDKRAPAVWEVKVYDGQARLLKLGSAVVTGHEELITNCHVLGGGRSLSIKHESATLPATLQAADPERDLCLLHASGLSVEPVTVADSGTLKVGERVYAIGAPHGLELTLSDGLVAALRRNKDGVLDRIQVSTPISPGSSGGGLFDSEGRLVGIPYMSLRDAQNLNFAIPAAWIREVPERGRAALAAYRAKQSMSPLAARTNQSAAPAAAASAAIPLAPPSVATTPVAPPPVAVPATATDKRLTAAQIQDRFAARQHFIARDSSGAKFDFMFEPDGALGVTWVDWAHTPHDVPRYSDGRFRIVADGDNICLSLTQGSAAFQQLQGCYWLYDEGGQYVMRAVSEPYSLTYPASSL